MDTQLDLGTVLSRHIDRTGFTLDHLSQWSGVPKATIANWKDGRVRKPNSRKELLRLLGAMKLVEADATEVLRAACYPSIAELLFGPQDNEEGRLLLPWARIAGGRLDQTLGLIGERGSRAHVWKILHEECQGVDSGLTYLRAGLVPDDLSRALGCLHTQWGRFCSRRIDRLVALGRVPDSVVRQEFMEAEHGRRWLQRMSESARRMDRIADECPTPEHLEQNWQHLQVELLRLEEISADLLEFLDSQVHRTLDELAEAVVKARENFGQIKFLAD